MPTWLIVVIAVLVVLVIVLFVAGDLWNRRYRHSTQGALLRRLAAADRALAAAAAADRGWDRPRMEDVARAALAERHPALADAEPRLVLVDDRPGTDEDRAVFEVVPDPARPAERHTVTLRRHGDLWSADA